jgi:HEAT repeat protein
LEKAMSLRVKINAAILAVLFLSALGADLSLRPRLVYGAEKATAASSKVGEAYSHLLKACLLYQQKKYDEAAAEVEEAMKLQPTKGEIVQLRDQIGEATLVQMLGNPKLQNQVRAILQLAEQETLRKQTDPAEIQKWVKDLESEDFITYWKAVTEMLVIGDYAVPYLLQTMTGPQPTHASTLAIVALNRMGWRVALPLIQALNCDNDCLKEYICGILGDIGDARAVPALKALNEDSEESAVVRGKAGEALKKITGKDPKDLPSAGELYRDLAEKYYAGDYKVVHALVDPAAIVWRWEDSKATAIPEKLHYYMVPRYMYTRIMAEAACFDGMDAGPSNMKLIETLVAVYYNGIGEIDAALRGYRTSTLGFKFSDDEIKTLRAMKAATMAWAREAEITGSKYINLALQRALAEGNGPMAGAAIQGLRNVGDDSPKAGVSGLIEAMAYSDKFVRYAAAEALVSIVPRGNLGGEVLAMRVLSAALTENAHRTILLVQRNTQLANALKAVLRLGDFKIVEVPDLNAANAYIRKTFLPVDVIILEDGILGADTVSFSRRLKIGAATPNVGVIVTTNKDAEEAQKAYGEHADAVLNNAAAAKELMEKVLTVLSRPSVKADEKAVVRAVKRAAVQEVAKLDPDGTAYPMKDLVPALVTLLDENDELLRTLGVVALGNIGGRDGVGKILAIIADKNQPNKLRGEALIAMGRIFERTRQVNAAEYDVVKAALQDPKVKAQAAVALGKADLGPKTLADTLPDVRLPIRAESVGGAAGAAPAENTEEGEKKE